MMMRFAVLGSGSAGNSTLLMLHDAESGVDRHVLIDAGFSPRQTAKRLLPFGLSPVEIDAIVVTHLDHDHFYPTWARAIEKFDIVVHAHRSHRSRASSAGVSGRRLRLFDDHFELAQCGAHFEPTLCAHDQLGSVGYVITYADVRLGYATDLGRVTDAMLDRFVNLDALAFESNYDPSMQRRSGRPMYLQRRIMGGRGHLSNEQSFEAIAVIAAQSPLQHVALLHLSQQCNHPTIVERLYSEQCPVIRRRLTITAQRASSRLIEVKPNAAREPVLTRSSDRQRERQLLLF